MFLAECRSWFRELCDWLAGWNDYADDDGDVQSCMMLSSWLAPSMRWWCCVEWGIIRSTLRTASSDLIATSVNGQSACDYCKSLLSQNQYGINAFFKRIKSYGYIDCIITVDDLISKSTHDLLTRCVSRRIVCIISCLTIVCLIICGYVVTGFNSQHIRTHL